MRAVYVWKSINTTLTTSGNSIALRQPKDILRLSRIGSEVQLTAEDGKIIVSNATNPRVDWEKKIMATKSQNQPQDDFGDLRLAMNDGLDSLPWNGMTYKDWQKNHGPSN